MNRALRKGIYRGQADFDSEPELQVLQMTSNNMKPWTMAMRRLSTGLLHVLKGCRMERS